MNDDLIERYRRTPQTVADALENVEIDFSHEGWTPRQIVHHLADAEINRALRLRRLLTEDRPDIRGWEENDYAEHLHYERPIDVSMAVLRSVVASNCELIECMTPEDWKREGTHPEFGRFGMDTWVERAAQHIDEHAEQILRCKR